MQTVPRLTTVIAREHETAKQNDAHEGKEHVDDAHTQGQLSAYGESTNSNGGSHGEQTDRSQALRGLEEAADDEAERV